MILIRQLPLLLLLMGAGVSCQKAASRAGLACSDPPRSTVTYGVSGDTMLAWYLRTTFYPGDTSVYGLPVQGLDSGWAAAAVIDSTVLPHAAESESARFSSPDIRYRVDADFNRDGQLERAVVGVFRGRDAKPGEFILILGCGPNRLWRQLFLLTWSGEARATFLALIHPDTLAWQECVSCGTPGTMISWTGHGFASNYEPEPVAEP